MQKRKIILGPLCTFLYVLSESYPESSFKGYFFLRNSWSRYVQTELWRSNRLILVKDMVLQFRWCWGSRFLDHLLLLSHRLCHLLIDACQQIPWKHEWPTRSGTAKNMESTKFRDWFLIAGFQWCWSHWQYQEFMQQHGYRGIAKSHKNMFCIFLYKFYKWCKV